MRRGQTCSLSTQWMFTVIGWHGGKSRITDPQCVLGHMEKWQDWFPICMISKHGITCHMPKKTILYWCDRNTFRKSPLSQMTENTRYKAESRQFPEPWLTELTPLFWAQRKANLCYMTPFWVCAVSPNRANCISYTLSFRCCHVTCMAFSV